MSPIHIKGDDGLTDATRKAMIDGREALRQHIKSRMNPNILIQPDGSCVFKDPTRPRRPPLSGHVCGPDGVPAIVNEIAEHNKRNRARIYDRVRGWDRAFRIGEYLDIYQVRFRVHRFDYPDVIAVDPVAPLSSDHDWATWFGECIGKLVAVNGYTLCIQDVAVDQLLLQVVGR